MNNEKIERKKYTTIAIDVCFESLFKPKYSENDKLPFYRFAHFQGYIQGICDAGFITEKECKFLDKCAEVAYYEIIKQGLVYIDVLSDTSKQYISKSCEVIMKEVKHVSFIVLIAVSIALLITSVSLMQIVYDQHQKIEELEAQIELRNEYINEQ